MLLIHVIFIMLMAIDTREYLEIRGQMTFGAGEATMIPGINWKLMIKNCLAPRNMRTEMAGFTRGGKTGGFMIRVFGVLVVLLMAAVTISR